MKTTGTKIVPIESIADYDNLYGIESSHPLVAVIDLKNATKIVNHIMMDYGIYALYLKNDANCTVKYGRTSY